MEGKKPLVVLTGPTASGKSSLGIQLALALGGEIVSADSMQIYRGMDIGTAKTLPSQWKGVPHHLLDILEPEEDFSVAEYAKQAREVIGEIQERGKIPFLVGGTSLYLQAVVDHIRFFQLESDPTLREKLGLLAEKEGNQAVWERLKQVDPLLAEQLHPNNLGRVIRGIEVFETSGRPLSWWQKESRAIPSPYQTLELGLSFGSRELLYQRINQRVEEMITEGLLEETEWLYDRGCSKTAGQAIGYKELWPVVEGTVDLETAVESLKQSTRRYAKRQLTWMRGRKKLHWIYRDEAVSEEQLLEDTLEMIREWLKMVGIPNKKRKR